MPGELWKMKFEDVLLALFMVALILGMTYALIDHDSKKDEFKTYPTTGDSTSADAYTYVFEVNESD